MDGVHSCWGSQWRSFRLAWGRTSRTPWWEKVMANGFALGILLAHNAKGCLRLCKEMSRMPKARRWNIYQSSKSSSNYGSISIPQLGAGFYRTYKPSSKGCTWILVATKLFTKWVEAVAMKKEIGSLMANFLRENIICCFRLPNRIISDNGTPFLNKDVFRLT